MIISKTQVTPAPSSDARRSGRRQFFRKAGIGVASAGVLLTACNDDDDMGGLTTTTTVNLGSGDAGILNYAYALEQLEAAFYAQVLTGSYFAGANDNEKQIFVALEAHERGHRDFFKAAIDSVSTSIPDLEVDFSSIDFSSRESVLATAQTFEDLGVSAYNGAGKLLVDTNYLLLAGKIVSVEARHAAIIRDIRFDSDPKSFAGDDTVDAASGLDAARTPAQVLMAAAPFIVTSIDASGLPQ